MDSLTQFTLGAALGTAAVGRRVAVWKAALWGGVCGTLPDLDSFIDRGDAIAQMTMHRTESHALLYLTLAAPVVGWLLSRLHREASWRRWTLAVWLALFTHPLLDLMTVYGTQLGLPFTDHPWAVGSIFIIDPLYTLPLLAGLGGALAVRDRARALRWNAVGLALATLYLAWSVAAQQHIRARAMRSLDGQRIERLLVTPTPFNTVAWRLVAVGPGHYLEGYASLLDEEPGIEWRRHDRGAALQEAIGAWPPVQRIAWFSQGFYKLDETADRVRVVDLRMGLEPNYTFAFEVARRNGARIDPVAVRSAGSRPDVKGTLAWLWRRIRGEAGFAPQSGAAPLTSAG